MGGIEKSAPILPQNLANALANIGVAFQSHGMLDEAAETLQRAAEIAPRNPTVLCNYALALNDCGRKSEARGVIEQALDVNSHDAFAMQAMALIDPPSVGMRQLAHAAGHP